MDKLFCENIAEYLALEKEALNILRSSKYVQEGCSKTNLQSVFSQSMGEKFSTVKLYFQFRSSVFDSRSHEVSLGCYFLCDSNVLKQASYSVEICRTSEREGVSTKNVVSRMHFDYASRAEPNACQHPVFHIQMWGKLPQYLRDEGVKYENEENSAISYPRMPFAPLSLALFLNMTIKELGSDNLRKLLKMPAWDELIKRHERKILAPFFDKLKGCLVAGNHLSKFYYAER